MSGPTVFSVQDETGTVAQLTLDTSTSPSPSGIAVGDMGIYSGIPDDGTDGSNEALSPMSECPFMVVQVLANGFQFSVSTLNANMADWPAMGQITWTSGLNEGETNVVTEIDGANAYISIDYLNKYANARGIILTPPPITYDPDSFYQAAIVQATDYLDHRYRFKGIKLLQSTGPSSLDANAAFLSTSWITPYSVVGLNYLTNMTTTQTTEWPRQGAIDDNGDTINGIPKQIQMACAELAIRVASGVALQPDYDPNLVGAGGVVSSTTKKVGPLEIVTSYDTKFGLGFFATFPVVDRLVRQLLSSGGGRSVTR